MALISLGMKIANKLNNLNNFGNNNNNYNNDNFFNKNNNNFNQISNNNNYNQNNNNNFNSNFNINRSNNNIKINNGKYSYKSFTENIKCYSNFGESSLTLSITIENNGSQQWVNQNTFLMANPNNYHIICQNIRLNPQLPGENNNYKFTLSNLNGLNLGEYKISYSFVVNGTSYGKDLDIVIYVINRNYHDQKVGNSQMNLENK